MYALGRDPSAGSRATWVEYEWSEPVNINKVEVYWAVDRPRPARCPAVTAGAIDAPESYRILYWNGSEFIPV